jgi:hypothetical protein
MIVGNVETQFTHRRSGVFGPTLKERSSFSSSFILDDRDVQAYDPALKLG